MTFKKQMLRAFIIYSLDIAAATAGWIYGFGMHVANWWALIGIMFGLRFAFHILTVVFAYDDADRMARKNAEGAK